MPKQRAVVDYNICNPEKCKNGICVAASACPTKTLKQEEPFEKPFPVGICKGCGKCAVACPYEAIKML